MEKIAHLGLYVALCEVAFLASTEDNILRSKFSDVNN
jgi:hypothetical protein